MADQGTAMYEFLDDVAVLTLTGDVDSSIRAIETTGGLCQTKRSNGM